MDVETHAPGVDCLVEAGAPLTRICCQRSCAAASDSVRGRGAFLSISFSSRRPASAGGGGAEVLVDPNVKHTPRLSIAMTFLPRST
eukprot:7383331-Prymnesium_polylepis.1